MGRGAPLPAFGSQLTLCVTSWPCVIIYHYFFYVQFPHRSHAPIDHLPAPTPCVTRPVCIAQGPGHVPAPAVVGKKGTRWWYQGHKGIDRKAAIAAQQRAEQAAKEVTEQAMAAAQACPSMCPTRRGVGCPMGRGCGGIRARWPAIEIERVIESGRSDIILVHLCALELECASAREHARALTIALAPAHSCALTRTHAHSRALAQTHTYTHQNGDIETLTRLIDQGWSVGDACVWCVVRGSSGAGGVHSQ